MISPFRSHDGSTHSVEFSPYELTIGGWLIDINTGRYMGALPAGMNFHLGQVRGSTYIGWTAAYKLVLVHFSQ